MGRVPAVRSYAALSASLAAIGFVLSGCSFGFTETPTDDDDSGRNSGSNMYCERIH